MPSATQTPGRFLIMAACSVKLPVMLPSVAPQSQLEAALTANF
jgi:hypothetical protein